MPPRDCCANCQTGIWVILNNLKGWFFTLFSLYSIRGGAVLPLGAARALSILEQALLSHWSTRSRDKIELSHWPKAPAGPQPRPLSGRGSFLKSRHTHLLQRQGQTACLASWKLSNHQLLFLNIDHQSGKYHHCSRSV